MRKFFKETDGFNNYIRDKILLTKEEIECQESEDIWQKFQYKFLLTLDVYNYAPFFERIVMRVFEGCVAENVMICELRHIFGFLFDDDHNAIETLKELEIYDRCVKKMKTKVPEFECRLIVCGLKILEGHPQKQIDAY